MATVKEIPGARREIVNEVGEKWSEELGPLLVRLARSYMGVWTGLLWRSTHTRNQYKGGTFYSVRLEADTEYAELHEKGRGPVFPVNAKVLRWFDKVTGKPVFRRSAGPAAGRFFLFRALKSAGLRGARKVG